MSDEFSSEIKAAWNACLDDPQIKSLIDLSYKNLLDDIAVKFQETLGASLVISAALAGTEIKSSAQRYVYLEHFKSAFSDLLLHVNNYPSTNEKENNHGTTSPSTGTE